MTSSKAVSSPAYKDLARAGAKLHRTVAPNRFTRLADECSSLDPVEVDVAFSLDDANRIVARCEVNSRCELPCHFCLESRSSQLHAVFDVLLADSEAQARDWTDDEWTTEDIVVTSGPNLDVIELVEDEMLLGLPNAVCDDNACAHRPNLSYAAEGANEASGTNKPSPFAALARLRTKQPNNQ